MEPESRKKCSGYRFYAGIEAGLFRSDELDTLHIQGKSGNGTEKDDSCQTKDCCRVYDRAELPGPAQKAKGDTADEHCPAQEKWCGVNIHQSTGNQIVKYHSDGGKESPEQSLS